MGYDDESGGTLLLDVGIEFKHFVGQQSKKAEELADGMIFFAGNEKVYKFHCDNSKGLAKACRMIGWPLDPNTPFEPQKNAYIEP